MTKLPDAVQCMTAGHYMSDAGRHANVSWYVKDHSGSFEFHRKEMLDKFERAARELGFDLVPIAGQEEQSEIMEAAE